MTVASVRIYYRSQDPERELYLSQTHWGFAEWFVRRLKPIRAQLRGPEVKGVNIVNFVLHEEGTKPWHPNEWRRRANSLEYSEVHDLSPLIACEPIENVKRLMPWAAAAAACAPWPQVKAIAPELLRPLSADEEASLLPFLRWPRGEA